MLIKTHALVSQHQRQKDAVGRVVATLDDYKVIHKLTADLFKATAADGLTPAQREAVEAVAELYQPSGNTLKEKIKQKQENQQGITVNQIAKHLGIDRSSAHRRLTNPLKRGYIVNTENQKWRPLRIVPGDPLPKDRPALPTPEELAHAIGTALASDTS
jgi:DNA-binding MarR family transcriptional regulator